MDKKVLQNIPKSPGIYKYFDKNGKILYIGKSVNLKARVNSYFNGKNKLNFAKKKMVDQIYEIETILTDSEKEALILETNLIKKHKPKYNILMKDDKNHTYIKIQNHGDFIVLVKTRIKNKIGKYFGPYTSGSYVKNSINLIRKIFGYGNSNIIFKEIRGGYELYDAEKTKIESLDYYISKSNKNGDKEKFSTSLNKIENFLKGNYTDIVEKLEEKMKEYAKHLKFEEAQKIKTYLDTVFEMKQKQTVRDYVTGDHDVINYTRKYGFYYVGVTEIRDSLVVGYNNYKLENKLEENDKEILEFFIEKRYSENNEKINVMVPIELDIDEELKKELKITIEAPKIGNKIELLKFVYKNVITYAQKEHISSLSTKGFTKKDMTSLLKILSYEQVNDKIIFECNDISHLGGTHTVASRSVIENGKTANSKYKKFNIKTLSEAKIDDFESMREIMTRRLKEIEKTKYVPDLIIIDGGKGQLSSVVGILEGEITRARREKLDEYLNNLERLQLVSIAKREEELFKPYAKDSILLSKDSNELRLTQKIRDEAHRFAITFNRDKRIKAMKKNILEEIPGIGPKTRKKIIENFGSIHELKHVNQNDLKKHLNKRQIEALEDHGLI